MKKNYVSPAVTVAPLRLTVRLMTGSGGAPVMNGNLKGYEKASQNDSGSAGSVIDWD